MNGSTWENYIYSRDHLGSIREVVKTAGSTNTLVARYDYDPYGKRLTQYEATAYTGGCDFGFTGHVTIPSLNSGQTEMVLTLFRAYDPQLGRWLSADPFGEEEGSNLYEYVENDPIRYSDMYGLQAEIPPNWPPPPPEIPGGPWKWNPDIQNSRGGTLKPMNPPSGQPSPTLTYDCPKNNPDGYWKHSDGKGNSQRYSQDGRPLTPEEAHPGRPPTPKVTPKPPLIIPAIPWWQRIPIPLPMPPRFMWDPNWYKDNMAPPPRCA